MALAYLDTSALVKLFVKERGTNVVIQVARDDSGYTVAVLDVARVELHSALHRRERMGDVPPGTAQRARSVLDQYLRSRFTLQRVNDALLECAFGLVERHGLRAYDALQLAGGMSAAARHSEADAIFVTSDRSLVAAANAEGLRALDPTIPAEAT